MARQIKRRRWARDGGVGTSELVVGDGEDGLGGEGQVLADLINGRSVTGVLNVMAGALNEVK